MATLREAMEWAKANPETDKAKQLYGIITSGQADEQAQQEGIDLSKFRRSQLGEASVIEPIQEGETKQSYIERIKTRLGERREKIAGKLQGDISAGQLTPGRQALRFAGGIAGGVSDIIFETIKPVIEPTVGKIVTNVAEGQGLVGDLLGKFLESDAGEELKTQFSVAKELVEKRMESDPAFAAKMRDVGDVGNIGLFILDAMGIGEALTGVKGITRASIEAGKELGGAALQTGKAAGEAAIEGTRKGSRSFIRGLKERAGEMADRAIQFLETGTFKGAPKDLQKFVDESIERSIRPSVTGKHTVGDIEQYNKRAREAVFSIVENKGNLKFFDEAGDEISRLPQSVKEFGDAVGQTKQEIFKQYDALAKQAGSEGAKLNLKSIADELDNVASNKVITDNRPEVAAYATQRARTLRARGVYTPEEAQEAIKLYNASLDAFYRNPSIENANRIAIDAMIANRMRTGLDNVIEQVTGAEYQELKNLYGSLKTIEKDITRRAIVEARKNAKGLIDYTDIFSAGDIVRGVVALDPSSVAKGAFQGAVKSFYKRWISPDATIKRMFEALDESFPKVSGGR